MKLSQSLGLHFLAKCIRKLKAKTDLPRVTQSGFTNDRQSTERPTRPATCLSVYISLTISILSFFLLSYFITFTVKTIYLSVSDYFYLHIILSVSSLSLSLPLTQSLTHSFRHNRHSALGRSPSCVVVVLVTAWLILWRRKKKGGKKKAV